MLKDITLGQFIPGNSILHRLDARIKLIALVLFIVALFMASSFYSYLTITLLVVLMVAVSKIPVKMILRSMRSLFFIIIFSTFLNIFYSAGDPIFSVKIIFFTLSVTMEGIYTAIAMILRIMNLIVCTSMLTYTTSPILLTDAIEMLLSPLKKIKMPVHEFAMMMTIALRMIPTLIEETDKIINTQKARGADFETGGLIKRGKALVPVLIPLFVSQFRRADELATAMECRCYKGGQGRTRLKQYKLHRLDFIILLFIILVTAAIFFLNKINGLY